MEQDPPLQLPVVRGGVRLLSDQPRSADEADPLGFRQQAVAVCRLIRNSRSSTPFTVGIEADWGVGKSTFMGLVRAGLSQVGDNGQDASSIRTVQYNAWSAHDGQVLEGLFKTILALVDDRAVRIAARARKYRKHVRLATRVAGRLAHVGDAVDILWEEMNADPRTRSELRDLVSDAMRKWRGEGEDRLICVFIDDLDRCSPDVAFEVFEAIKVYLDAPGIIFVIAYDNDVLSDAILEKKGYAEKFRSDAYLQKIVQVTYRILPPKEEQTADLIGYYVRESRLEHLIVDDAAWQLLLNHFSRNPREIKRSINDLALEYERDLEWGSEHPRQALRKYFIDYYYPAFGQLWGERGRGQLDLVELFTEFEQRRASGSVDAIDAEIPEMFQELADDPSFVALVGYLGDATEREALRQRIANQLGDDWTSEVTDPNARLVLQALLDSRYEFRTLRGIASETHLSADQVRTVFERYPQFVRASPIPDRRGTPLYAARSSIRRPTPK